MNLTPLMSSDAAWVEQIMTADTERIRVYLYSSVVDYEEGVATATEMVDSDLQLGTVIRKWLDLHGPRCDLFILEVLRNPRF